jgi:hypothetical protein
MSPLAVILLIILAVVVVAFGLYIYFRERRTKLLRSQFGPEYSRTIKETGDRAKAEERLREREKRVRSYSIRPLSREDRTRFLTTWQKVQADFVDDPDKAIQRADDLLGEVMETRGYPVSDFDQRSADLSVDHPEVVENYRAAHQIAVDHEHGGAGTEELRQAMIHYRALFEELVTESEPAHAR